MTIWTLVAILCLPGEQCMQTDLGAFPDEQSCLDSVDAALLGLHRAYVESWVERGMTPPQAQVGIGCREDEPV